MTLSKQEESAAWQVYETFWSSYLIGDMPTIATQLADDFSQIGSAETEVFDNKKDALHFIETTIDQIVGKLDIRNRVKKIEHLGSLVHITEFTDLYVLTEGDWVFYAKFRVSAFLEKKEGQWKFIHLHSSMPDIRADEGENIATEKISRENIELRDAIKRRTTELEQKNQELALEASLERVRTMAMGMRKPDDLPGICEVLFNELRNMGFTELRNAMINIHNDEKSTFINYDYSEEIGPSINHLNYTIHPVIEKQIKQIRSTHDAFSETVFTGQDLEDWKAFRKRIGEKDDPRIDNVDALYYYFYSIGTGAIGISTFGSISTEKLEQLKRFRNVFEFAYRRYMDVAQAEAQAREAQIEAALEKVRSRSLIMQGSNELKEVIAMVFEKLKELNFNMDSRAAIINIYTEGSKEFTEWITDPGQTYPTSFIIPELPFDTLSHVWTAREKGADFSSRLIYKEEKNPFFNYLFSHTGYQYLSEEIKKGMLETDYYTYSIALGKNSGISLPDLSGKFLNDSEIEILKRFAKVFDQAYTRFLDLQKAESQARESQIQLALERVRARTMAMQKSEELKEVAKELRVQLAALGTDELETCAINLYEESDDYLEAWVAVRPPDSPKEIVEFHYNIPKKGIIIIEDMLHAYHSGVDEYVFELGGSKGAQWMNTMEANMPEMFAAAAASDSYKVTGEVEAWFTCDYFSGGALVMITMSPPQHESGVILKRFKQVFGLAYRRFADLKKAEAQTREALIEAALERVRSRTMGMQKSDELKEVIKLVYQQLIHLKINLDHSGFVVDYIPGGDWHFWIADEQDIPSKISHPYFDSVWANQFNEAKEKGADFFVTHLNFEEKNKFYNELLSYVPGLPEASKDFYLNCPGLAASTVLFDNISLYIENFSGIPYTDEENNTLMRFGKVFQQTYTRFLDLQKAEAQARESQIELGLERVRARAMAMQHSGELSDLVATLLHELTKLDFSLTFCIINIYNEPDNSNMVWAANPQEGKAPESYYMKFEDYPFHHAMMREWKAGTPKYVYVMEGKEKEIYDDYLYTDTEFKRFPEEIQTANRALDRYVASFVFSQFGGLQTVGDKPLSNESLDILYRFGKVFDQTYTRFLDLQKAEAQARDAQIEVSLERVRSRSMAMHKSDELLDAGEIIFIEMQKLGIESLTAGLVIIDKEGKNGFNYAPNPLTKKILPLPIIIPHNETIHMQQVVENWKKGNPFFIVELDEGETIKHQTFIAERSINFPLNAAELIAISPAKLFLHNFYFKEGYILIVGGAKLSVEQTDIMLRFAKVFQQTYTRFLDLQKAEAQVREATIETSLERMRAKTMAMHSSDDVSETAATMFTELEKLGVVNLRGGIAIISEDQTMEVWGITNLEDGKMVKSAGVFEMKAHPVWKNLFACWKQRQEIFTAALSGKEKEDYIEILNKNPHYLSQPIAQIPDVHFLGYYFGEGYIWTMTLLPPEQEDQKILKRFAAVFSLTFRRYLDLKKAEAQALEAIKRASVDRVRAEIASMRTTTDLDRITPLIWKELTILGIPFVRCGVFIMDEQEELIHTFLSTPDGKAIAAIHLPYQSSPLADSLAFWREKKIYLTHWGTKEYTEFADAFIGKTELEKRTQFLSSVPREGIYLHLHPFLQGMLYVGNITQLNEDNLNLIQSVADAFSTAYARYEDFNRLEAAKEQVDKTLTDLKQAQSQLVQAEKMASLGELTAGIAHEIQNPLNFVNNFSEINTELSDEIVEAAKKGDLEEIIQLAADIKSNQDKISEHGKRADAIVKGMLQHSRSSSGVKEPTDINKLADEYFRLSYHGLRAKDKTFNATLHTDFDTAIGKIPIMSQDIGRVLLNLYNNAFYAVSQKMNEALHGYEPRVTVSTRLVLATENSLIRQSANSIIISVTDNGNGIPAKVLDKIFQPFFTTKPTGQGTGLGLSLSYDIVKAHGGELRVETSEGEGSEFVVQLPT